MNYLPPPDESGGTCELPGIYRWWIGSVAVYVGRYTRASRPRVGYERNVARLLEARPYRPNNSQGFRRIHRELAEAVRQSKPLRLEIVENCEPEKLNEREQFWISKLDPAVSLNGRVRENPPRNGEVAARSADGGVESPPSSPVSDDSNRPLRPSGAPPRSGEDLGRSRHRTVGADPKTVKLARKLRREMTLPEVLLWRELKGKPLGMKFRKQFGQLGFVADFACVEVRLMIEIDGIVHGMGENPERDLRRDATLKQHGWRVVRIAAKEVLADVSECAASMVALAASLRPLHHPAGGPPPRSGEVLEAPC